MLGYLFLLETIFIKSIKKTWKKTQFKPKTPRLFFIILLVLLSSRRPSGVLILHHTHHQLFNSNNVINKS